MRRNFLIWEYSDLSVALYQATEVLNSVTTIFQSDEKVSPLQGSASYYWQGHSLLHMSRRRTLYCDAERAVYEVKFCIKICFTSYDIVHPPVWCSTTYYTPCKKKHGAKLVSVRRLFGLFAKRLTKWKDSSSNWDEKRAWNFSTITDFPRHHSEHLLTSLTRCDLDDLGQAHF